MIFVAAIFVIFVAAIFVIFVAAIFVIFVASWCYLARSQGSPPRTASNIKGRAPRFSKL